MQRRDFLFTAAAGVAAAAGAIRPAFAQGAAPQGAPPAREGRGGQAANRPIGDATPYPRSPKAARIAMMSLNFANWIKDIPDVPPGPQRTIAFFELPQMVADVYDIHLIEYQSAHFEASSPAYFKSLRDALAKSKSRATQINANFEPGVHMAGPTLSARMQAVTLTKDYIDQAVMLGAQRVMVNQAHLSLGRGNLPQAIEAFKAMADYGKSKNIVVSIETRGGQAPPVPRTDLPKPGLETWQMMKQLISGAGAYANPDVGNANAMNQQELHQCLSRELLFPTAGNMHSRVNPNWDLTAAVKYVNGLGYNGLFTAEAPNGHEGSRPIYEAVLAAL